MQRFVQKLHRDSKGFTMAEVLITVAIIIVLLALAAPNVVKYQRQLKQMELHKTAEEIYLSVQNTLTAYKTAGTLDSFISEAGEGSVTPPSDYSGETEDGKLPFGIRDYIISSDDVFFKKYLYNESLSPISGKYYIEFFDNTCEVYGVFYAIDSSKISKENLDSYRDNSNEYVAYYGGKPATLPDDIYDQNLIKLDISSIDDDNVLALKISMPDAMEYVGLVPDQVKFTLTFSDGENEVVKEYNGIDTGSTIQYAKVIPLDSINDVHFCDISPALCSGKLITVSVDVEATDSDGIVHHLDTKNSNYKTSFNPLFNFSTNLSSDNKTIFISNVRHLNNLNSAYFTPAEGAVPESVSQLTPIDFSKAEGASGYTPISSNLTVPYDGNGLLISNTTKMLFKSYKGDIRNVTIVNPRIEDSNSYQVGALVGTYEDGTVSNCGVRYDVYYKDGSYIKNLPAKDDAKRYVSFVKGADDCGGLIGKAVNATISNSYAAVDVYGKQYTGGFAGVLENCSISQCYSSGIVQATQYCGGFAGKASGSIQTCYSTSDVMAVGNAGGFAYSANGAVSCASYGRLMDTSGQEDVSEGFSGFAGIGSFSDCSFLQQDGYNDFVDIGSASNLKYDELVDYERTQSRNGMNYDTSLDLHAEITDGFTHMNAFPFNTGFAPEIPHYGDWPHDYILSDNWEDYTAGHHMFVCTVCKNKYPGAHHWEETSDPNLKVCTICNYEVRNEATR